MKCHSKSIISNARICYKENCNVTYNLHRHHVYEGRNRKNSEKYGLWVYLCGIHHNLSNEGVHFNKKFDKELKQLGQKKFEENYPSIDFLSIFRRNYKD